jgi:hypothetical protein
MGFLRSPHPKEIHFYRAYRPFSDAKGLILLGYYKKAYGKDLGVDKRVFRIKNRNQVALAARFDDYVQLLGRTRT